MPDDLSDLPGDGGAPAPPTPPEPPATLLNAATADLPPDAPRAVRDDTEERDGTGEAGGTDGTGTPAAYELSIPDGMAFEPGQLRAFEVQARELGLSGEQAQKLLETAHANRTEAARQHAAQVERWAEDLRRDPELGGDNFNATVMTARDGLKRFDPDGAVLSLLESTGYGNHPDVIRFLGRIGQAHAEDAALTGRDRVAERPLWDRLYGG